METRTRLRFRCMGNPEQSDDMCLQDLATVTFTVLTAGDGGRILALVPACEDHHGEVADWLHAIADGEGWSTSADVLEDEDLLEAMREVTGYPVVVHARSTW